MTTTPRLLTTRQVATRLGVDPRTVHRMAEAGRLPYVAKLEGSTGAYVFDPAVIDVVTRHRQEGNGMSEGPLQERIDQAGGEDVGAGDRDDNHATGRTYSR